MNCKRTAPRFRRNAGQIELFAAILVVATMIVIGYVFFLIDSGASAFYKEKLQDVTAQGASFAAGYQGVDAQTATHKFITSLCEGMGLQASELRVVVQKSTLEGQSATSCEATAVFPLLPNSFFPATVTLTGSSVVPNPGTSPHIVTLLIVGIANEFIDKNATVTGEIKGIMNKVASAPGSAKPPTAGTNPNNPTGTGQNNGINNTNTGTGDTNGIGNNSSGSGDTTGIGNNNSGSGDTTGIGNNTSGSGNTTGIANNTSGSGNTTGIGNNTSGSGNTSGIANTTSGSGDTSGIGNHTSGSSNTTGIANNSGSGSGNINGIGNSWN